MNCMMWKIQSAHNFILTVKSQDYETRHIDYQKGSYIFFVGSMIESLECKVIITENRVLTRCLRGDEEIEGMFISKHGSKLDSLDCVNEIHGIIPMELVTTWMIVPKFMTPLTDNEKESLYRMDLEKINDTHVNMERHVAFLNDKIYNYR